MKKKIIIFLISLPVVTIFWFFLSFYVVNEQELVIITQFGKTVRTIDQPGWYIKMPSPIQTVNRFEKRALLFETQPVQYILGDKNPLIISCFVSWKISNPLLFFQSIIYIENAKIKIEDMVTSILGNLLGEYSIENIINIDKKSVKLSEIEQKLLNISNEKTVKKYGIEIKDVGIKRVAYPSIVTQAVYKRMKSEREKEADKLKATGKEQADKIRIDADKEAKEILAKAYKKAEIIKGEGDKKFLEIYGKIYKKAPEFFDFLKSLETYKTILKKQTTLILSTESELFKYLNPDRGTDGE